MEHIAATRRMLATLLCLLMMATTMQAFDFTYKGVQFKCKEKGQTVTITSFDVRSYEVTIPAQVTYKGVTYAVKQVSTFMNGVNYLTVNLILEEGIEDIDKFCFNEFRRLQSVRLPSTIRHIGRNAFRDNKGLMFDLPSGIEMAALMNGDELWPAASNGGRQQVMGQQAAALAQARAVQEARQQEKEQERLLKEQTRQQEMLQKEQVRQQREQQKQQRELAKQREPKEKKDILGLKTLGSALVALSTKKQAKQIIGNKAETPTASAKAASPAKTSATATPAVAAATTSKPAYGPSDIDVDIPVVQTDKNKDTYVVIIANEKYEDVPEVEYAERDGETFRQYCIKTLGVPERQVKTFLNASFTDVRRALNWIEQVTTVTEGQSQVIVYYAGHGIPSEKDQTAYLIPVDGFPKDIETCFKLSDIYARLSKLHTQRVTVFLDACFSGVKRGSGQALIAARGVAIRPKQETLGGKMIVFSATSDDETALAYQDKHHGMFTYYLLSKLRETRGKVKLGDLYRSVKLNVSKNALLENQKAQTPTVNTSASMNAQWAQLDF